jgi:hypothetical protein
MDHSEEAVSQLSVSDGDGAVDLELSEHALGGHTFARHPERRVGI